MAHNTKIGKGLLEQLMFSLYSDAKTIYREYLQNAADAIQEAQEEGILSPNEGHVSIKIDQYHRIITIEDNGIGIPTNEAEARLKDIAKSSKHANYFAGFYGIGRLVGAGYCKQLSFKTSAKGENVTSEMVYDVDKIRAFLNDTSNDMGAAEVMDAVTTFFNDKEDIDKHYFIVTLENILPEYLELLEENKIYNYLLQVAPIPFAPEFKNNLIKPKLEQIDKKYTFFSNTLTTIQVSLNNFVNICKPYGLTIAGTNDEIDCLRFFCLHDAEYGDLAWGWYAITPFEKAIPDTNPDNNLPVITRGIRLRSHNIQIGGENFFDGTEYFKQARSNKYFNGEIHIIHPNIKPNTARDGLANTVETVKFKELIREFFNEELQKVYQTANKVKKVVEQMKESEIINDNKKKCDAINAFAKIQEKGKQKTEGMQAMLCVYQRQVEQFNNQVKTGTFNTPEKKKHLATPKVQKHDIEQDYPALERKYGKDAAEMIKRIFRIMDNRCRFSTSTITRIKNFILKDLKEHTN